MLNQELRTLLHHIGNMQTFCLQILRNPMHISPISGFYAHLKVFQITAFPIHRFLFKELNLQFKINPELKYCKPHLTSPYLQLICPAMSATLRKTIRLGKKTMTFLLK